MFKPVQRVVGSHIFLALVISLGACIVALSTANNPALTVAYDSGHYLASTQLLVATILNSLQQISPDQAATIYSVNASTLGQHLMLDGPLLPGLGAIVFILLDHVPQGADWRTLVAIGALSQTCTTALIFYLALRLSERKFVAASAALIWAFYPPAVLSCNSFVSEPVVTTLLLATVACLERISGAHQLSPRSNSALSFAAGAAVTCVFISKPALAPLLVLTMGIALWFSRRSLVSVLVPLLLGLAAVETPWIVYTSSLGQASIASRRAPTVNIVKGSDVTADGWNTFPDTQLAKSLLPLSQPMAAYATVAEKHSAQLVNLTLRKSERLWVNPWNDFRSTFVLPVAGQIWWHRLLLISGVVGLLALLSERSRTTSANFLASCSLAVIVCHAIYLPFEACPRYAYSAMPFFVVLAANLLGLRDFKNLVFIVAGVLVAILCSLEMTPPLLNFVGVYPLAMVLECAIKVVAVAALCFASATHYRKWGTLISAAVACSWIAVLIAHLLNPNESREYRTVLKPGHRTVQQVPSGIVEADQWTLLLIDGGKELEKTATISVNGHVLPVMMPLSSFSPVHFNLNRNFYEYAGYARKDPGDLRQWRATCVPNAFLNSNGDNQVTVQAQNTPVTIYGARPNLWGNLAVPSTIYYSPALQFFKGQPLELRPPTELIRSRPFKNGAPNIFFLTGVNPPAKVGSNAEKEGAPITINSKSISTVNSQFHTRVSLQGNVSTNKPVVVFLSAKLGPNEFQLPGSPIVIEPQSDGSFEKEIVIPPGIVTSLTATIAAESASTAPNWTLRTRSENLPLVGIGQATLH